MQTILTVISVISAVTCLALCLWLSKLKHDKQRPDRSCWMYCRVCIVKWRPTAYGPPAPDDYYCPICKSRESVRPLVGFTIANVKEFEEGVTNEN